MKVTTVEVLTEDLFELAKCHVWNGVSIYQFLFERYAHVRAIFIKVINTGAHFKKFVSYFDSVMTRGDAIQFLLETGHFSA